MTKKSMAYLSEKGKSSSPVEDTVQANWDIIVVGLANGHSLAAIRTAMKEDGFSVGKWPSGFNSAFHRVAKRFGTSITDLRATVVRSEHQGAGSDESYSETRAADGQCLPMTAVSDARPTSAFPYFADDRFSSPFGGSDA